MNNLCIKNVTQELSNLSYLFTYVTVNLLMVCTFRLGGGGGGGGGGVLGHVAG